MVSAAAAAAAEGLRRCERCGAGDAERAAALRHTLAAVLRSAPAAADPALYPAHRGRARPCPALPCPLLPLLLSLPYPVVQAHVSNVFVFLLLPPPPPLLLLLLPAAPWASCVVR